MIFRCKRKMVVSFLVSGNGILFSSIAKKILKGDINARIGCVVTDNKHAKVIQRAIALGVICHIVEPDHYASKENYEKHIICVLEKENTDMIVTAGYLRLLGPFFVNTFKNRIINIHPSLLPSFPGLNSQMKAYEYGVKVTGCTTHFIDEGIDTGPIIMQSPVSIIESETVESLSLKILAEEKKILSESIRLFCNNKIKVVGLRVKINR